MVFVVLRSGNDQFHIGLAMRKAVRLSALASPIGPTHPQPHSGFLLPAHRHTHSQKQQSTCIAFADPQTCGSGFFI
ncbi:hypothetical protein JEQ12_012062 [Ovis aries]|uniref:Uncharacterized protein n=1 Tax=Ovis aries TaxID=9940 RepID=A0A835ZJI5_SHEEP|nr:hypothetical protein JEQ12_012062 [Ovis aries]